jgi:flagellar biosynthesis protein
MNKDEDIEKAVALHYSGKGSAPRVTAKGSGALAEQIIALAREHNVPIQEDRELVQLLAQIELGDEIPELLYIAVAEVLSFAYYVSGRVPGDEKP